MPLRPRPASLLTFALTLLVAGTAAVVAGDGRGPTAASALISTVVPAVDTNDRAAVDALYRSHYLAATPLMGWTGGSVASCQAGSVSLDYQLAVVRRVNYFRALAGVRADTTLASGRVAPAQAAALMMSAANALDHSPASSWPCFSAEGASGAASSNLALGVTGPEAVDLYMLDPGAQNATVGHRWWLLQPAAATFASGNVPPTSGHAATSAVYVFDVNTFASWPAVRDPSSVVLWPPRGYVPRPNVPDRWSVFDDALDFANATITVTVNDVPVTVVVDARGAGLAVWRIPGVVPAAGQRIRVTITGATAGGAPASLDYTTNVFEPSVGGAPGGQQPEVEYQPVVPTRLLDTRPDGPPTGYSGAKPSAGQTIALVVAGAQTASGAVPGGAAAVALNVTVTEPVTSAYVTVWPCGEPRPTASNVNVVGGQTLPNLVVVPLGENGTVCLFTQASAHLLADLNGWFPAGTSYRPVLPERLLDTRSGGPQVGYTGGKPAAGRTIELQVTGTGRSMVAAGATAALLNVTVTEPGDPTYVTVWPCGEARPTASNLNAVAGQTVANLVVARIGAAGKVCLFTQSSAHVVADLNGWFPAGSGYVPTSPQRLLDTRPSTAVGGSPVRLVAGQTRQLAVASAGAQPAGRTVVLNVTAVDPAGPGFVTVWPCGSARPMASNLNVAPGLVAANLVLVAVDTTGAVCFYANTALDLVVDRNGDF